MGVILKMIGHTVLLWRSTNNDQHIRNVRQNGRGRKDCGSDSQVQKNKTATRQQVVSPESQIFLTHVYLGPQFGGEAIGISPRCLASENQTPSVIVQHALSRDDNVTNVQSFCYNTGLCQTCQHTHTHTAIEYVVQLRCQSDHLAI